MAPHGHHGGFGGHRHHGFGHRHIGGFHNHTSIHNTNINIGGGGRWGGGYGYGYGWGGPRIGLGLGLGLGLGALVAAACTPTPAYYSGWGCGRWGGGWVVTPAPTTVIVNERVVQAPAAQPQTIIVNNQVPASNNFAAPAPGTPQQQYANSPTTPSAPLMNPPRNVGPTPFYIVTSKKHILAFDQSNRAFAVNPSVDNTSRGIVDSVWKVGLVPSQTECYVFHAFNSENYLALDPSSGCLVVRSMRTAPLDLFEFVSLGNGAFYIRSQANSMYLTVDHQSGLVRFTPTPDPKRDRFFLSFHPDVFVRIKPALAQSTLALDASNGMMSTRPQSDYEKELLMVVVGKKKGSISFAARNQKLLGDMGGRIAAISDNLGDKESFSVEMSMGRCRFFCKKIGSYMYFDQGQQNICLVHKSHVNQQNFACTVFEVSYMMQ